MFRSWISRIVVGAVLAAILGGACAVYRHQRYKHFAVHEPGMVYRSAWLEPEAFAELIHAYQIRAVVNLCTPGEMGEARWEQERAAVRNAGARLIELEMPVSVDVDTPAIARHLDVLSDAGNYPLLVHCQHGVTRTAKFLAIYDIALRGQSAVETLDAQPLFGRPEHNVHVQAFVRNFEKQHARLFPTASADRLSTLRH